MTAEELFGIEESKTFLPALAALYGVVAWGKWYYADICHHHRD